MMPLARRSVVVVLALLWGFPGQAPAQGVPSPSDPPEQEYDLPFSGECGMVTRYASNRITPACLTEAQNIVLDEDFTWSRRRGQSVYNATACTDAKAVRGLWPFDSTDGTRYLIIFSSQSFFSSTAGDCSQITSSTFSATAPMSCAQGLGKLVCSNGTDAAVSIDSNLSTATLSDMPRGELVGFFRNRFLTAKIQGALTRIYGSGDGDPTDWTLVIPGRSTSPFTLDIAGTNDGKAVTCLLGEYQNAYFVGRDDELLAIYGNDRRDFTLRKISDQVGCSEPYSVKEKNNALYWISRRGVEKMSGTSITRISDPIRPTIDEILTAAGNSVSATDTTQADFEDGDLEASGPGAPMSATISPASVVPTSFTAIDQSGTDYQQFASSSSISTTTSPGLVTLQYSTFNFSNADFSSDDFTNWTAVGTWVIENGAASTDPMSPCAGTGQTTLGAQPTCFASGAGSKTFTFEYINSGGVVVKSCSATLTCGGNCEWASDTCTSNAKSGTTNRFDLDISTFGGTNSVKITGPDGDTLTSGLFPGANNLSVTLTGDSCQSGASFQSVNVGLCPYENYAPSGSATSRAFNTQLSTPTFGPFDVTVSSNSEATVTFQTQSSSDGSTWDSAVSATPGIKVASAQKKYIRYLSSFSTSVATKTASYGPVEIAAATTGYFISQCRNPGSSITSWGLFSCGVVTNDGSISLAVSTGSTCNSVTRTTATWNSIANNTIPSFSTAAYVAYRALFSIDSATQTPTLQSCTINWNEGSDRPDVVAEVYRDRYHLYYTTSTASGSYNDHALVLDQNDKWTIFDGVTAAAVTVFKNKLYTGDSQATGKIYIQDVGHDDLGEPFTMRFRTADLDFGDPTKPKSFKTLYVMMHSEEEPTQDIPVTFRYRIDGATTTYSLGSCNMDEASEVGYFVCKLPFSVDEAVDARWLSVEAEYTGSQGPVRIYGMKFIYSHKERE